MHNFRFVLVMAIIAMNFFGFGQTKKRILPASINQPSVNVYAPALSGDGETMVYLSDYSDDGYHIMYFATKQRISKWNESIEVSKVVNNPKLNYRGGYSLSFEGDELLVTSRKSGLGGFDLWYAERQNDNWGTLKNFGKPINSSAHEGTASLSADGQWLYFMRCDNMTLYQGASGCKLLVTKRKYGRWDDPVELPEIINTGNSQNPKILADGETLIFSSDKMGGQGGLDLFMTRKVGRTWTKPLPMDFMNTEKDDQFISIPAKGRYLYTSQKTGKDFKIVQLLIPEEMRPKSVMRINGVVVDQMTNEPINAHLTIFDVELNDRVWNGSIGEAGEFAVVLNEGSHYDFSLTHPDAKYHYFSKMYALDTLGRRDRERLQVVLSPLTAGNEYEVQMMFRPHSSEIDNRSTYELRRLVSMLRKNPEVEMEINVSQTNYREDSVQSDLDLTEVHIDTIASEPQRLYDKADSTAEVMTDSIQPSEILTVRYYHNDRTAMQAENIRAYFIEKGIDEHRLTVATHKMRRPVEEDENEVMPDFQDTYVTIKITTM